MSRSAPRDADLGPYKGAESYERQDFELFRGREHETREVKSLVLSSCLSLLHAESGAGKTSLLNARVLPGLEALGWLPVRVRPGFNPLGAVKIETLKRAIPCPAVEAAAVRGACAGLEVETCAPLGDLLDAYEQLPVSDDRKRTLLAPVASPVRGFGEVTPFFHAWLQQSLDDASFGDHLATVLQGRNGRGRWRETPIDAFVQELSSPESEDFYHTLLARVNVPAIPLAAFFQNLTAVVGPLHPRLCLVLILDQFEELFTRFVDPGPAPADAPKEVLRKRRDQPDWRLRVRFFEELEELYRAAEAQSSSPDRILPIRYLISLRDDYYAKLGPIRRFVRDLERSSYHLQMLGRSAAAEAIRAPAAEYCYRYSDELFRRILDELTREDRYIEPAHLQMVCTKLWRETGRELSRRALEGGSETQAMGVDELERLQGTAGIFDSVLSDFLLEDLDDDGERSEAVELLEPLITGSYTRNIVERDSLLRAPFKDHELRERILQKLEDARVVRIEVRHDGYFVEITHEFLIPAILKRAQELRSDSDHAQVSLALLSLSRLEDQNLAGRAAGLLSDREFQSLDRRQEHLLWPEWGVEAMLRSAIGVRAEGETLRHWADRFEAECSMPSVDTLRERMERMAQRGSLLNLDELAVLTAADREAADRGTPTDWSDDELEAILRSLLALAPASRKDDVIRWTRQHGDRNA